MSRGLYAFAQTHEHTNTFAGAPVLQCDASPLTYTIRHDPSGLDLRYSVPWLLMCVFRKDSTRARYGDAKNHTSYTHLHGATCEQNLHRNLHCNIPPNARSRAVKFAPITRRWSCVGERLTPWDGTYSPRPPASLAESSPAPWLLLRENKRFALPLPRVFSPCALPRPRVSLLS